MTYPDSDHIPFSNDPSDDEFRALVARAEALPTLRPSRDLWPGIAARLDALPDERSSDHRSPERPAPVGTEPAGARVLAFRAPRVEHARPMRRQWLAAAAVALVSVSSSATYLAMRRPAEPAVVAAVATEPAPAPIPDRARESDARRVQPERAPSPIESRVTESEGRSSIRPVVRSVDLSVPGAADYDREIAELRAVVADRPGELDSATVDVLTRNLRIIDAAIAASRAALARDPHSPFLGEQLTRALGQKVDLLRTAALLPRT